MDTRLEISAIIGMHPFEKPRRRKWLVRIESENLRSIVAAI